MTLAKLIARRYGNDSQGAMMFYQEEKAKRKSRLDMGGLPITEWFPDASIRIGRRFLSPFEMYGLLGRTTMELS